MNPLVERRPLAEGLGALVADAAQEDPCLLHWALTGEVVSAASEALATPRAQARGPVWAVACQMLSRTVEALPFIFAHLGISLFVLLRQAHATFFIQSN